MDIFYRFCVFFSDSRILYRTVVSFNRSINTLPYENTIRKHNKFSQSLLAHAEWGFKLATQQAVHTTSFPCCSVLVYIGLLKNSFFVNFPYSDFWGLLICYRGHFSGPKSVKKHSFAISVRLADFSR